MIKNILFIGLTFFSACLFGQTFQATYGFPNVDPTTGVTDPGPFPSALGLNFGPFKASGVSANPSASGRFSFTGWPIGAINAEDNYANYSGALSGLSFYEVTIYVQPTFTLNLSTVDFSMRRSGTGIRNFCVRSQLDNFTNNLAASTGTNTKLSAIPTHVFFWNYDSISSSNDQYGCLISLGNQYKSIADSVTFHFYAWNAEVTSGSFSIDNVRFSGFVSDTANTSATNVVDMEMDETMFKIYPNPSSEKLLWIESEDLKKIDVYDVYGKMVYSRLISKTELISPLDLCSLPPGIYFVSAFSDKNSSTRKIILDP